MEYEINGLDGETRLDKWISECGSVNAPDVTVSRSALQKLIENGAVKLNGETVEKKSRLIKNGDRVEIFFPEPEPLDARPQDIPIDVIYEDSDLLVVNKPKGMVVHPAAGHPDGSLVNALLYRCKGRLSSINGVIRPGIVHRIDKDTSGLLAVAKTDAAHAGLAEQIKEHSFTREYRAVVCGRLKTSMGTLDFPIGRHPIDRKKMCVPRDSANKGSRPARTDYSVLAEYSRHSYVSFRLYTGRTHQIRVHAAHIGHPVLGDAVYGKASKLCAGQCLHAKTIGFIHPITGKYLEFDCGLPDYFMNVLKKLENSVDNLI